MKMKMILSCLAVLLLIVDPITAANGMTEGLNLCTQVIVPSLFPFFFLSSILNDTLCGIQIPGFKALRKFIYLPKGGESFLVFGFLGGYPVGAKAIADAYAQEKLNKKSAQCLLSYCNNAGPAFIFGITGRLFSSSLHSWLLWIIHILSALIAGYILSKPNQANIKMNDASAITLPQALQSSIRVSASVCGWILVFKVILAYVFKLTSLLNVSWINIYISGLLELSNGCIQLSALSSENLRFILCSTFLAFGGMCVLLQTASVVRDLGIRTYLYGKLIQTAASFILSAFTSCFLYPSRTYLILTAVIIPVLILILLIIRRRNIKRYGIFTVHAV